MVRRLRQAVEIREKQTDIEGSYFLSVVTVTPLTCQKSVPCPKGFIRVCMFSRSAVYCLYVVFFPWLIVTLCPAAMQPTDSREGLPDVRLQQERPYRNSNIVQ